MKDRYTPWKICGLGQLSILLEVSAPKPGNVNRVKSFSDTSYRHFLASASLFNKGLYDSAVTGCRLGLDEINAEEVHLGRLIYQSSDRVFGGLELSNTILGTILLFVPLTVAISSSISEKGHFSTDNTKRWLRQIIDATGVEDSVNVYKALRAVSPSGEKHKSMQVWREFHSRFDISNPNVFDHIRDDELTLAELFKMSAEVDPICEEWTNNFSLVLDTIMPKLNQLSKGFEDIEEAIVETFIWLLAQKPDGLIVKKAGWDTAKQIQQLSKAALKEKGNSNILDIIEKLDRILRSQGNLMNPGSTADFLSAGIFCKLVHDSFGD